MSIASNAAREFNKEIVQALNSMVRVVIDKDLPIQSEVGLELFLEIKTIICKARVVWNLRLEGKDQDRDYGFDTGIEFMDINQKDQKIIEQLVDSLV